MSQRIIKPEFEVKSYIDNLKYAVENGAVIVFAEDRLSEKTKPMEYRNKYALADLFPDESPVDVFKRELPQLVKEEYLGTVPDDRFPDKDLWEFGKVYDPGGDVYIKFRVELMSIENYGNDIIKVVSFHYAETALSKEVFPYK